MSIFFVMFYYQIRLISIRRIRKVFSFIFSLMLILWNILYSLPTKECRFSFSVGKWFQILNLCTTHYRSVQVCVFWGSYLFISLFMFWPCSMACEILVPQPGIEPKSPALEAESYPLASQEVPWVQFGSLHRFWNLFISPVI